MKIKQVLALLFVVTFSLSSWADRISPEDAAAIAASFVNNQPALRKAHKAPQTAASMRLAHTRQKASSTENAFYVFNRADKAGFIIVSADDRTAEDVLGYSDNGAEFNMETINPNLRWWLDRYAEEISAIDQDPEAAVQPRKARQAVTAIAPLLVNKNGVEITWYQETPYNNYCPIDQRDNTRCYTGCVATASAQIMYKWQYPAKGTGSHSYTWKDCKDDNCTQYWSKTMSSNFDTVTFNWDNMLPAYGSVNYTTAQAKAVASLMYNMGIAAEMSYGGDANGGSGAWTDVAAYGLKNFFGYEFDRFITMYSQSNYGTASVSPAEYGVSTTTITNYFNTDLEAGRPILMGGEDSNGGGHEFVCDGRDANNKFHINWGWEGDGNGYFAITALKPTGTSYNFSTNIDALIGLRPAKTYADVNVTWMANGQQFDQTVAKSGVLSLPTSTPADCVNGKEFVGWTAVADYEGDAAPEFVISGTLIEENATYYAVYATKEEGQGGGSSEESLTFSNLGLDNQADVDGQVIAIGNNSSITFSKGTGSNGPKYYNTGSAIRAYGGNTIVVEATGNMSEIVFSFASGEGSNAITADKGTYDNGTWTGDANSVTFTIGGTSGHRRIASVKVTVAGGSGVSYSDFSTSCGSAEPCVLSGLDLNTDNVQKTFVTGEAFNYDGLIVTAFYSNCNSRVVTPTTVTNPDMSVAGEKAITVRYDENGSMIYAAYTINVVDPETYTIRFINNGVQIGEAQNVVEGQSPVVPENPEACEGYEFFGWFTETFDETTNAPAKVEDFTAVKDQDYYAVFSRTEVTEGQGGGSAEVADELTVATTGVSGNTYTDWSGISVNSSAVYAGQSAGGNNAIQLRSKNSNSGIITTSSGGTITKVTVAWNSNTSGRTLDVYGSNTAYTNASDLYGNNAGTKLGSIASDTDTDLVIEGDYAFVGVRSNNSALYMDAITFTWKTEGGSGGSSSSVTYYTTAPNCEPVEEIAVTGVALDKESVTLVVGQTATLVATVLPENATNKNITWTSDNEAVATVANGVVTAVGAGETTITVITVDGNFQAQCIVSVNAPVVKEWYTIEEVVAMFDGTLPTEEITVRGYVTKIQTAYSAQYGNISFWMDDTADGAQNRFEAYRTVPVEESDIDVAVGDYVEAKGTLTLYGSTKEFAQGGTYHILSGHETVAVEGVELDQPDAALTVGDSILLIATVLPENATNKNVTWSTSNDKVAIVEYGLVIAVGVGDAEITVTTEDGQFSATCSVIVEEPENPTYYTIRFFNNGEQIGAEQVILENSFPEVPADPTPTCENHTFVGWWTDSLGKDNTEKKDWITDFKATKDQDYHAIFSKKVQSEGQGSVTEHVTFADLGYENSAEVTIVTMDNCTLTFDKGTGTTTPKYYTSGAAVRCYKNNTLTITSDNAITGIAVTTVSGYDGVIKASEGEYSDGTWSGSTTSVTLTNAPEDNAQWRIVTIEVTTGAGSVTYYSSLEYCDESAIEAVEEAGAVAEKVLRNGQIFILRGDAVYSITGARVQ